MLSILVPSWIAVKMMSPNEGNSAHPYAYSLYLPTWLTISRTIDKLCSPLLPHRITVDKILNTPDAFCDNNCSISTMQSFTTDEKQKCNVMPAGCRNQSLQILLQSQCWLYKSASGQKILMLESANWQQIRWEFGRISVAWQHNR